MAAHKIKAVGRASDGSEVAMYFETLASLVICTVPDEDVITEITLDELLNQYADEINENTSEITKIEKSVSDIKLLNAYLHIRWGTSAAPSTLLTTPAEYIGIASTSGAAAPASYTGYSWYKYKGEKGDKGDKGDTGSPGAKGVPGSNAKINGMDVLEIVDGENTKVVIEGNKLSINADIVGIPRGIITMWSGALNTIPEGWALCDGQNDTPNLCDRFIVGAGNTYKVGDIGGSASHTLTTAQMPAHSHSLAVTYATATGATRGVTDGGLTASTKSTGGGGSHENRPPYYALAYIVKI